MFVPAPAASALCTLRRERTADSDRFDTLFLSARVRAVLLRSDVVMIAPLPVWCNSPDSINGRMRASGRPPNSTRLNGQYYEKYSELLQCL
jgi:hypothetical protein